MKHYALIFYPFTYTHSRRTEATSNRDFGMGERCHIHGNRSRSAEPFGSPLARLAPSGGDAASGDEEAGPAFTNIVFFNSASEEQAMRVAKMHPGLRYGTRIEVREWTSPRAAASTP